MWYVLNHKPTYNVEVSQHEITVQPLNVPIMGSNEVAHAQRELNGSMFVCVFVHVTSLSATSLVYMGP